MLMELDIERFWEPLAAVKFTGCLARNVAAEFAHRRSEVSAFKKNGSLMPSPFFGQHLVKLISSTVGQRTILVV
jgi:hypothetical protein